MPSTTMQNDTSTLFTTALDKIIFAAEQKQYSAKSQRQLPV